MASRVVTPEAVLLELPTAGPAVRALARLFDLIANAALISMGMSMAAAGLGVVGLTVVSPLVIVALGAFLFLVGVPVASEILSKGRTLGKTVFGLKVVGVDGSRVSTRQVLVREFVALPELFLSMGVLGMVSMMFSERSQRLGDLAAGTVVIRGPSSRGATVPVAFHPPHGYEAYVQTLAVAQLHDDDFVLIRDFLLRVKEFTAEARASLALALARTIRTRVPTPVPAGMTAELWLICVASAYQYREGGLLADAAIGLAPLAPLWVEHPRRGRSRRGR